MRRPSHSIAILCLLARSVAADPDSDADAAFKAAEQRAAAGEAGAIDELERIGAMQPVTRWSDDAWAEAARLAERAGDYDRARRDLAQAIAVATDDRLRQRAQQDLARIRELAGAYGQWAKIAADHERLEARIQHGDPKPALHELEALVRANPQYPRAALAMLAIARGWQRDGDAVRALTWLRDAAHAQAEPIVHLRAQADLVRAEIRVGELDVAAGELDKLDPDTAAPLRAELATAQRRELLRWVLASMLFGLAAMAAWLLRRAAGSWRAAGRRVLRPPGEILYYLPIAAVLAILAATGNPLVARAVRAIAITGAIVGWLSGAILDAQRARTGQIRLPRLALHAAVAAFAVIAATYLAFDRDRMIDLVIETWREGPAPR